METKWNWKLPKKNQLVILLLTGVLLIVIAMPEKKNERKYEEQQETAGISQEDSYERAAERRLERILREVEGVGEVKVMITLKASSEKIVEKDKEERGETTVYNSVSGKEQTPYVKKEMSPQAEGVVVIAQGGDNAVTVKNITDAVQALFDIDTHKIKVMKRNQIN